jgi:hypothetical protein
MTDPTPLTDSGILRKLTDLEKRQLADESHAADIERRWRAQRAGRYIENICLLIAAMLLALQGISEVAEQWYCLMNECRPHSHGFPWAFVLGFFGFLLPKGIGKLSGGKVWESIAANAGAGLGKLIGRGRPAGPGEQ